MTFKREYFDKIAFNMTEFAEPDYVAVHVWKAYKNCRVVRIHVSVLDSPDMWETIYQEAMKKWETLPEDIGLCPHCHNPLKNWERLNYGRHFCGFCGEPSPARNAQVYDTERKKHSNCTKVSK
jgi:hypothetical protein